MLTSANAPANVGNITQPFTFSETVSDGGQHMGVRLRGSLRLLATKIDGYRIKELSALGWDEDESILYAVSDRGFLFHFKPVFSDGNLVDLTPLAGYPLTDAKGKRLRRKRGDSEALVLWNERNGRRGDTRLSIAFERDPKVIDFAPNGTFIHSHALPAQIDHYDDFADPNSGFEALAKHAELGLITAPEHPLPTAAHSGLIDVFGLNGGRWYYALSGAKNSSLVAMEALPDGSLLTLERAYRYFFLAVTTTLRRTERLTSDAAKPLRTQDLAVLRTLDGWHVDNFEGLTRHQDMRFFMVSDNNNRSLQQTLLVYFEVLP